jgi:hypothetical protein
MPYKDAENKRQWEREHREKRNARRRERRLQMQNPPFIPKLAPDPVAAKETGSGWGVLIGIGVLVLGVGLAVLGVNASLSRPPAN